MMESFLCGLFCDDGDGLTRHWQLFFFCRDKKRTPDNAMVAQQQSVPLPGRGTIKRVGRGAPTLQYEREQGAFFDGSRLSVGRAFTISGRPQNRVIEKSIRPPVPKDGLGPHP